MLRNTLTRLRAGLGREARYVKTFSSQLGMLLSAPVLAKLPEVQIVPLATDGLTNPSISSAEPRALLFRQVDYRLSRLRRRMVDLSAKLPTGPYVSLHSEDPNYYAHLRPLQFAADLRAALFEDGRLFNWRGGVWVLFAYTGRRQQSNSALMALGRVRDTHVEEIHFLPSPHGRAREKNWMPLVDDDRLLLAYDVSRLEFYEVIEGKLALHREGYTRPELTGHLGTSPFVRIRDGWLGVTHRSVVRPLLLAGLPTAFYVHYFVELTPTLDLRRVSLPFFLHRRGVEFCTGLLNEGNEIVMTYGENDIQSEMMRLPNAIFERLFVYDRGDANRIALRLRRRRS